MIIHAAKSWMNIIKIPIKYQVPLVPVIWLKQFQQNENSYNIYIYMCICIYIVLYWLNTVFYTWVNSQLCIYFFYVGES